ncbi:hypothetical protein [Microbispora triticiradicis]|uniref:hypothetical protein n=1 Tax=Microbispora triticiradicis TaxID=2200763 RepID=UPI0010587E54|nr:hypothetical protein [Microbispora triticiradicis]
MIGGEAAITVKAEGSLSPFRFVITRAAIFEKAQSTCRKTARRAPFALWPKGHARGACSGGAEFPRGLIAGPDPAADGGGVNEGRRGPCGPDTPD